LSEEQPGTDRDPLVIRDIEYLGPMATVDGWRPETTLPEVAFTGRSNVGKSSLLNRLVRRKALARVSKTPGRTREIHFFRINTDFVLADLPGYGYARVSKERQREWRPLMESYLRRSAQLRGVVQLLDVRRDPSEDDLDMFDFLAEVSVPVIVAVTKVDKLSRAAARARMEAITTGLRLDAEQVIPFSAVTGEGRDDLATAVMELVRARAEDAWVAPTTGAPAESDAPSPPADSMPEPPPDGHDG
jgi:GTP-binding protein